jgi:membrane protein required for colicin V production
VQSLNWADWTIIAILAASCLISLLRGFVKEALSLLVWISASFVGITFQERFATVLAKWVSTPSIRFVLAFAALFTATLIIGAVITRLLQSLVESAGLGGLDRILGMVFGAARGLLIVLALVILLPLLLPVKQDAWWYQSRFIPHFETLEDWSKDTFQQMMGWGKSWSRKLQGPDAAEPVQ